VKVCTGCSIEKPLDEFAFKNKQTGRRAARCKTCHSRERRDHYELHRQKYIDKARKWRRAAYEENQQNIIAYLLSHPCVDCGETDVVVLDFDHRGDKSFTIATSLQFVKWERIAAEIAKCDVRCANCHRRKTARERGYWRMLAVHAHEVGHLASNQG
jgi:hypothetical protein